MRKLSIRGCLGAAALAVLSLATTDALAQGDAAKGEKIFIRCKACHSIEPGQNKIGPTLAGVIGRKAGTVPDFNYSDAMKAADIVWDEANLDAYLDNPKELIPGNKMAFPGLKKEQDRADVIAFLKAHSASAEGGAAAEGAEPAAEAAPAEGSAPAEETAPATNTTQ
jgi:cytochrome c2